MKNDIIEVGSSPAPMSGQDFKRELSLSGDDINRVVGHLAQVQEAVSKVLKEGIDNDYGIVPGTKKKALLKPGAEKLLKLFGLGARFRITDKEFDRYENFAMFTYECEVYHLKTGIVLANCEGTANSQEVKYKERSKYVQGVFAGKEVTPICDILNTLKKMAQKRALVGAVIIATAASDYFTQDEEEIEAQQPQKKEATKADSSRFKKDSVNLSEYVAPLGKFKGKKLLEIEPKELSGYVEFLTANNPNIDGMMKTFIDNAREFLRTNG